MWFIFSHFSPHYPTLFLTDNKLICLKSSLFCPLQQLVSDLPVFTLTHTIFYHIFSPCPVGGRAGKAGGAGQLCGQPANINKSLWTNHSGSIFHIFSHHLKKKNPQNLKQVINQSIPIVFLCPSSILYFETLKNLTARL